MKRLNLIYGILFLLPAVPFTCFLYLVLIQGWEWSAAAYYWAGCKITFSIWIFTLVCVIVYLLKIVKKQDERIKYLEKFEI